MNNTVLLDRSTLLFDYQSILSYHEEMIVVIPFSLLEELRNHPPRSATSRRNCDELLNAVGELSEKGDLFKGVKTSRGALFRLHRPSKESIAEARKKTGNNEQDIYLFATALDLHEQLPLEIITRDSIVQAKAALLKLEVSFYKKQSFKAEELYPGYTVHTIEHEKVLSLREKKTADTEISFLPNEYLKVISDKEAELVAFCRYNKSTKCLTPLSSGSAEVPRWVRPRNIEQSLALDALLDDSVKLVTLIGKAGTGKTLLAIAAGLYKTIDENKFDRILVSRPTLPMGQDIGFLPGSVEEKLTPWMYPIADNVDLILRQRKSVRSRVQGFKDLSEMGVLLIEPLTYIRGRSIHNQYLIVDEAQNLTTHEIKTILTRAGEGTKIILAGDPYQIDNPDVISTSSGLMQVVEKLRNEPESAHITFTQGERSRLSELAADLL